MVFGIAVLVITSLLVNAQPARSALSLPFSTEMRDPTMLIDVTVDPAVAGKVEVIHLFIDNIAGKLPYTAISRTMHIHPTVSELIPTLLQDLKPLA